MSRLRVPLSCLTPQLSSESIPSPRLISPNPRRGRLPSPKEVSSSTSSTSLLFASGLHQLFPVTRTNSNNSIHKNNDFPLSPTAANPSGSPASSYSRSRPPLPSLAGVGTPPLSPSPSPARSPSFASSARAKQRRNLMPPAEPRQRHAPSSSPSKHHHHHHHHKRHPLEQPPPPQPPLVPSRRLSARNGPRRAPPPPSPSNTGTGAAATTTTSDRWTSSVTASSGGHRSPRRASNHNNSNSNGSSSGSNRTAATLTSSCRPVSPTDATAALLSVDKTSFSLQSEQFAYDEDETPNISSTTTTTTSKQTTSTSNSTSHCQGLPWNANNNNTMPTVLMGGQSLSSGNSPQNSPRLPAQLQPAPLDDANFLSNSTSLSLTGGAGVGMGMGVDQSQPSSSAARSLSLSLPLPPPLTLPTTNSPPPSTESPLVATSIPSLESPGLGATAGGAAAGSVSFASLLSTSEKANINNVNNTTNPFSSPYLLSPHPPHRESNHGNVDRRHHYTASPSNPATGNSGSVTDPNTNDSDNNSINTSTSNMNQIVKDGLIRPLYTTTTTTAEQLYPGMDSSAKHTTTTTTTNSISTLQTEDSTTPLTDGSSHSSSTTTTTTTPQTQLSPSGFSATCTSTSYSPSRNVTVVGSLPNPAPSRFPALPGATLMMARPILPAAARVRANSLSLRNPLLRRPTLPSKRKGQSFILRVGGKPRRNSEKSASRLISEVEASTQVSFSSVFPDVRLESDSEEEGPDDRAASLDDRCLPPPAPAPRSSSVPTTLLESILVVGGLKKSSFFRCVSRKEDHIATTSVEQRELNTEE